MASAEEALRTFVANQKRLLELELRAEEDATADVRNGRGDDDGGGGGGGGGRVLRGLDAVETSVGLYGRTVVTFGNASTEAGGGGGGGDGGAGEENGASNDHDGSNARVGGGGGGTSPASSSRLLPAHRLTVGDEVSVLPNNGKGARDGREGGRRSRRAGGVISAVDDVGVSVALFGADYGANNHDGNRPGKESSHKKKKRGKKKSSEEDGSDEHDDGNMNMLGGSPPYALVPKSNAEVHRKILSALDELERHGVDHPIAGDVVRAGFEPNRPSRDGTDVSRSRIEASAEELDLTSTQLDVSQREAVVMALRPDASPISLVHGPPGTGKTTAVSELVRCAVRRRGWKVLVAAPSNVAVDNVLERIMSLEEEDDDERRPASGVGKRNRASSKRGGDGRRRIRAARLGHPARMKRGIQRHSLESLVRSADGTGIVEDVRSELQGHLATLSSAESRPSERRAAYREMRALRKEVRTREERVVTEVLGGADVVLATTVGAASSVLGRTDGKGEPFVFDLVVIDEAAQALEASCWISLLRGKRAVLAGDHKQLPPTIKCSVREVQRELGRTLFERLIVAYEKDGEDSCHRSKMLEVQYRMHQSISDWASNAMYNGKLISHESVKGRQLSSLPLVAENAKLQNDNKNNDEDSLGKVTLMLIDTTGCDMHETANEAGSKSNEGEGRIVASHVQSLIELGLRAEDIAVITPYNGQVELLRKMLLPELPTLEVRSVDGFQGGEREAVVLSLVRSSDRGGENGIGFLSDERRLNVAITRAKRHCAVVCDCETVSKNKFIKGLVDWMEEKGEYRSGAEYDVHNTVARSGRFQANNIQVANEQTQAPARKPRPLNENPMKSKSNAKAQKLIALDDSSREVKVDNNTVNTEADRRAMMEKIKSFSESAKKDEELELLPSSEYDAVLARELAKQLGIGCRDGDDTNKLVLVIQKETKTASMSVSQTEDMNNDPATSKFSQLDIDDESSDSSNDEEDDKSPNNLLRQLALEREKRHREEPKPQAAPKPSTTKKKNKKGKGQKVGGSKAKPKEESGGKMDDLDDMAFLDAQIEKVQTSHGRKVDAKGKGYRSVVNGILLSKPASQWEEPKRNSAASSQLQAKIKSKARDRKVKKKKK